MNEDPIVNRVANSPLITVDLESMVPNGPRMTIDLSIWLDQGWVLREKEFRTNVKDHDWTQYQDAFVNITCSTDAIVPSWAYMLIATQLQPIAQKSLVGSKEYLESELLSDAIEALDVNDYKDKPLIIKGCSDKAISENDYLKLTQRLQPVAKSIMFGEACSSVPIYKKPG